MTRYRRIIGATCVARLAAALEASQIKPPPRFQVKAPDGAPNLVIVLIDDPGFGVPGTFGGPVPMPTLDGLAQQGLRYNNFHTTALCSPTRAALMSGRNSRTRRPASSRRTRPRTSGSISAHLSSRQSAPRNAPASRATSQR